VASVAGVPGGLRWLCDAGSGRDDVRSCTMIGPPPVETHAESGATAARKVKKVRIGDMKSLYGNLLLKLCTKWVPDAASITGASKFANETVISPAIAPEAEGARSCQQAWLHPVLACARATTSYR